jgi:hypothetical protein
VPTIPARTRFIGDETPIPIWWFVNGSLPDYTTGYTFEAKLYRADDPLSTIIFTKTTGLTGAAGSGVQGDGTANLTVAWATTGELNTSGITTGRHVLQIKATKSSDSSEDTYKMYLDLETRV